MTTDGHAAAYAPIFENRPTFVLPGPPEPIQEPASVGTLEQQRAMVEADLRLASDVCTRKIVATACLCGIALFPAGAIIHAIWTMSPLSVGMRAVAVVVALSIVIAVCVLHAERRTKAHRVVKHWRAWFDGDPLTAYTPEQLKRFKAFIEQVTTW